MEVHQWGRKRNNRLAVFGICKIQFILIIYTIWSNLTRTGPVKKIVLENRRVGITEVAEALIISYGSTQRIVVHVLGMKHVAARLVPKDRNFLQKERGIKVAEEMLANVADDSTFIKRIITGDKT